MIIHINIGSLNAVPVECTTTEAAQELLGLGPSISLIQYGAWAHKYHTPGFIVDGRVATNLEMHAMTIYAQDVVAFNKRATE